MTIVTGRVRDVAVSWNKASFEIKADGATPIRVVLFSDEPNSHTIPQVELATRSWMLALIQTAFTTANPLTVKFDEANMAQQVGLELPPLKINPDVVGSVAKIPVLK